MRGVDGMALVVKELEEIEFIPKLFFDEPNYEVRAQVKITGKVETGDGERDGVEVVVPFGEEARSLVEALDSAIVEAYEEYKKLAQMRRICYEVETNVTWSLFTMEEENIGGVTFVLDCMGLTRLLDGLEEFAVRLLRLKFDSA